MATAYSWPGSRTTVVDRNGDPVPGARLFFFVANTTTPLVVYSDAGLSSPLPAFPDAITADASGRWPRIFMPYTDYAELATTPAGVTLWNDDGIANPPPSSGGGGGSVPADQLLQVGDVMWRMNTGARDGFVRLNGRTIGAAASAATERANADCEDLFAYLWDSLPDSVATVSSGRGGSAAADFAANKTIVLPSMQGIVPAGVDDMGAAAANRIQVTSTITTTLSSDFATVGSAAGLNIGMTIIAATVPAGTTITAISGAIIQMSTGAGVTAGTGTAARFSMFADAQSVGFLGGVASRSQLLSEIAAHNHGGGTSTDGNHQHGYLAALASGAVAAGAGGAGAVDNNLATQLAGAHSHSIPIAGAGVPAPLLQPTRLGTWYMKR